MNGPIRPAPARPGAKAPSPDTPAAGTSFLARTVDALRAQESKFPHRALKSLSEWASHQERSGLLRIWAPAPRVRTADGLWIFEDRDIRIDPFFFTSVLFHLLLALLLWRAIAAMPVIEPPKKEEVIVKLEDFLPKQDAGSPAAAPAPKPEQPKPAAPRPVEKKVEAPRPVAPKPAPVPKVVVRKPVPKPEPEPVLVPKEIVKPKSISPTAQISPDTPTEAERIARAGAPTTGPEVVQGAGTSAAGIAVDSGAGTGVRGPVGPISVPGGTGAGTGLGAGLGRGNAPGDAVRGYESDPDFSEYLEKVRRRMFQVWMYPQGVSGRQWVVLRFTLDAGARPNNISVKSSSNALLNDSSMDAMRRASPFPPIPDKFRALVGRPLAMRIEVTVGGGGGL